jgi:hypothetical protein
MALAGCFLPTHFGGNMTTLISNAAGESIPGPAPLPLLGRLPLLLRFAFRPLETLEDLRQKYGKVVRLGFGNYPAVVVFDPEYNRQILRDPDSFYVYDIDLVPIKFPENSSVRAVTTAPHCSPIFIASSSHAITMPAWM